MTKLTNAQDESDTASCPSALISSTVDRTEPPRW